MTNMPKTMQHSSVGLKRSSRFTLIELLVVIAVIAMLAALLMPALAKARYRTKNVLCMSNQKQIAAGVLMYTSDYDDHYPSRTSTTHVEAADVVQRTGSGTDYANKLRPYFGGNLKGTWLCPLARLAGIQ